MTVADAPSPALPRTYLTWLSGFTVGRLGDATLAFALGWAAAGLGGSTAALVLVLGGLPRLVLLVVGGAVADRFGARRLLVVSEAALVVLTCTLALAVVRWGTPAWLLAGGDRHRVLRVAQQPLVVRVRRVERRARELVESVTAAADVVVVRLAGGRVRLAAPAPHDRLGFSRTFVLDAVRAARAEHVALALDSGRSTLSISPADRPHDVGVVMPVLLRH